MSLMAISQGSKYSDEDMRRAALEYSIHGNITRVSEITNIPDSTLCDWKKHDWWDTLIGEYRERNKDLIDAQLEQLAIKGFQAMHDRIDHGDTYITKDGKQARKPVSLRDVSTASGIAYDKLRLHRNQATTIRAESTDARLTQLADKVRELQGGMVTIEGETADK